MSESSYIASFLPLAYDLPMAWILTAPEFVHKKNDFQRPQIWTNTEPKNGRCGIQTNFENFWNGKFQSGQNCQKLSRQKF